MARRVAVIDAPSIILRGWAPLITLFDEIAIPDLEYIEQAAYEIEHPEVYHGVTGTIEERKREAFHTICEVATGLNYYLRYGARDAEIYDHAISPFYSPFLEQVELLEKQSKIKRISLEENSHCMGGSYALLPGSEEYSNMRVKTAITAQLQHYDTCLFKTGSSHDLMTEVAIDNKDLLLVKTVLKNFPTPSAKVPLDEVLAFQNDSDVKVQLSRLRIWIKDAVSNSDNLKEFEDQFIVALHELERATKRLERNFNRTAVGIVGTVTADFADNVTQFKWGSAIKGLLSWQKYALEKENAYENLESNPLAFFRSLEKYFSD